MKICSTKHCWTLSWEETFKVVCSKPPAAMNCTCGTSDSGRCDDLLQNALADHLAPPRRSLPRNPQLGLLGAALHVNKLTAVSLCKAEALWGVCRPPERLFKATPGSPIIGPDTLPCRPWARPRIRLPTTEVCGHSRGHSCLGFHPSSRAPTEAAVRRWRGKSGVTHRLPPVVVVF